MHFIKFLMLHQFDDIDFYGEAMIEQPVYPRKRSYGVYEENLMYLHTSHFIVVLKPGPPVVYHSGLRGSIRVSV